MTLRGLFPVRGSFFLAERAGLSGISGNPNRKVPMRFVSVVLVFALVLTATACDFLVGAPVAPQSCAPVVMDSVPVVSARDTVPQVRAGMCVIPSRY